MQYFLYKVSTESLLKTFLDVCNVYNIEIVSVFPSLEHKTLSIIYKNTTDLRNLLERL